MENSEIFKIQLLDVSSQEGWCSAPFDKYNKKIVALCKSSDGSRLSLTIN